jgi:cell division septum initiation protein DivIVA
MAAASNSANSYLDTFLSSVEDAPQDVRRNLQHMRALDTEAQELVERIKKLAKVHVTRAKRSVAEGQEPSEELLHKLRGLHRKVEEIANEKVDMANHISDQVRSPAVHRSPFIACPVHAGATLRCVLLIVRAGLSCWGPCAAPCALHSACSPVSQDREGRWAWFLLSACRIAA